MRKSTFFYILSGLCLIAAVILVLVGVRRAGHSESVEGLRSLGQITLTYDEESTMNYMSGKSAAKPDPDGEQDAAYTVVFTCNHPQCGLIRYDLGVDTKAEFDALTAANADLVFTGDVFVEPDDTQQALSRSTKQVYVYAWPKTEAESADTPEGENSRYHFRFYDDIRDVRDVEKEIQGDRQAASDSCGATSASSTVYFIIAAIPLLGAAYLLFLGLTADRPQKTAQRGQTVRQAQPVQRPKQNPERPKTGDKQ